MIRLQRAVSFLTVACAAAACGESSDSAQGPYSILTAVSALESAIAACGDERKTCEESATDAVATSACEEASATCRDGAKSAAKAGLERGVSACRTDFATCREAATTADDRGLCKDELKACVAEDRPTGHGRDVGDGGVVGREHNPNAACITSLRECIEGDGEAKLCAEQLRSCLSDSMSNRNNGGKPDGVGGGKTDTDASTTDPETVKGGKPDGVGGGKPTDADAGTIDSETVKGGKPDHVGGGKPDAAGR